VLPRAFAVKALGTVLMTGAVGAGDVTKLAETGPGGDGSAGHPGGTFFIGETVSAPGRTDVPGHWSSVFVEFIARQQRVATVVITAALHVFDSGVVVTISLGVGGVASVRVAAIWHMAVRSGFTAVAEFAASSVTEVAKNPAVVVVAIHELVPVIVHAVAAQQQVLFRGRVRAMLAPHRQRCHSEEWRQCSGARHFGTPKVPINVAPQPNRARPTHRAVYSRGTFCVPKRSLVRRWDRLWFWLLFS
jgi:hypothetical protein